MVLSESRINNKFVLRLFLSVFAVWIWISREGVRLPHSSQASAPLNQHFSRKARPRSHPTHVLLNAQLHRQQNRQDATGVFCFSLSPFSCSFCQPGCLKWICFVSVYLTSLTALWPGDWGEFWWIDFSTSPLSEAVWYMGSPGNKDSVWVNEMLAQVCWGF